MFSNTSWLYIYFIHYEKYLQHNRHCMIVQFIVIWLYLTWNYVQAMIRVGYSVWYMVKVGNYVDVEYWRDVLQLKKCKNLIKVPSVLASIQSWNIFNVSKLSVLIIQRLIYFVIFGTLSIDNSELDLCDSPRSKQRCCWYDVTQEVILFKNY